MKRLHDLILDSAESTPEANALLYRQESLDYAALGQAVLRRTAYFKSLGITKQDRIAVYLDKRPETVVALFAAAAAGAIFVPINPLLKPSQVGYILQDCNVRLLVTSSDRLSLLNDVIPQCPGLTDVIVTGATDKHVNIGYAKCYAWDRAPKNTTGAIANGDENDLAAILYTSGSSGNPKGVVLTHRNMMLGAASVAEYLSNDSRDRLLAVLPFSFDYGLSQLTTGFLKGASVVLMNYLLPGDIIKAVEEYRITGLAAVPPLWIPLAHLEWPETVHRHLRYLTSSGGALPQSIVQTLNEKLPNTELFLMYGLTEAFRSTFLPPDEITQRPGSIGKAIPNVEVLVVRQDGSPCGPDEIGELVHTGELVAQGYWNDEERSAEQFRPAPAHATLKNRNNIAVWSGDQVKSDTDGYLYFVGRNDDMIKTSGYRVSPSEVEEVIFKSGCISEAAALGLPHPQLGQAIVVVATARNDQCTSEHLLNICKQQLPAFMVPTDIQFRDQLPKSPNGKIDRKQLSQELKEMYQDQGV